MTPPPATSAAQSPSVTAPATSASTAVIVWAALNDLLFSILYLLFFENKNTKDCFGGMEPG